MFAILQQASSQAAEGDLQPSSMLTDELQHQSCRRLAGCQCRAADLQPVMHVYAVAEQPSSKHNLNA